MPDSHEPVPAIYKHGTVIQLKGEPNPRVVGATNREGHAIAFGLSRTPSGKKVHPKTASADVRVGGTVDAKDVKGVRKRRMNMKDVLRLLNRGHKKNIAEGHYSASTAAAMSAHVQENWKK